MQLENPENKFEKIKKTEPRNAAEIAYVIAMIAKNKGDSKKAIRYGKESIQLFDQLDPKTLDECAAVNTVINGIALPDLIHSDVVRDRLSPLEI
jgi:hypothetical protein